MPLASSACPAAPRPQLLLQNRTKEHHSQRFFFRREHDFISSSMTQSSFWKEHRGPGRCPHLRRPLRLLLSLKILAQELAWVHSCNAFSGRAQSEVVSGYFLISPGTLRSPSQRLVSALTRAKFSEIKAVEELHPHCSPLTSAFASQLSVRLLEETKSELWL